jgi:tricorn protease
VANHRHELFLVDPETGTARLLDRSAAGGLDDVVWSPDGRWLAYSFAVTPRTRSIKLCELSSGATHLVTRPEFRDVGPSWDPEGRFLYFLSYRTFDPVSDSLYFDLGFPKAVRPYLITLSAEEPSPFVPKPRGLAPDKPSEPSPPDEAEQKVAEPIRIDIEGIRERVVAFPVPEGRYSQVVGIKGQVLLCAWPVEGHLENDLQDSSDEPKGSLEVYDLAKQHHEVLVSGLSEFTVSRDGHTLCYRSGRRLRAIEAGKKPP